MKEQLPIIVTVPNQLLREVAKPVTSFDDDLKRQGQLMARLLEEKEGVGLAATQIGLNNSVFVVEFKDETGKNNIPLQFFVNPAIIEYSSAININPNDSIAYYNRALAYEGLNDFQLAINDYSTYLPLAKKLARLYNNRGNCYMELNIYGKARKDFNKALKIQPNKNNTLFNIGVLMFKMGKTKKACKWFNKAVQYGYNDKGVIDKYCK